ncbi:PAN domain-containing protein [Zea mays]|uniref:non-specific serine/threonine protein kinase n=1 Tax=Zea mays TaxID=4577 RepID=A0A3L6EX22_MAIZE|nr:PAN domain-containing protein [Zea mays]
MKCRGDPAIAAAAAAIGVLCVASAVLLGLVDGATEGEEPTTQLLNGFTAAHAAGAPAPFQPVLYAPSGAFALGFLRVGAGSLDLAVVHLPSSFPVWRATPARLGDWSRPATLTFDGGLELTGHNGGMLWQTLGAVGDVVVLLNSSNLVVRRFEKTLPEWESFRHPSDTLVLGQNFTASSPPLVSANRRFALRLGKAYMALHMEFYGGQTAPAYWRHTALMAQPENATEPPVYGSLDARGFFGLYLEGGGQSVDVLSFDTFAQNLTAAFRRMTLDDDGNLRAYYWASGSKAWASDYRAISERCDLPTPCGAYGLCVPRKAECQCLDNSTSTAGAAPSCHAEETADLCAGNQLGLGFDVVRRKRVSVAYKEELPFETNRTAEECEAVCAGNCSCWGAVHSGASGYCYLIDFPVETLVYEADDRKVGYFKVKKPPARPGDALASAVLSLVLVGLAAAGACIGGTSGYCYLIDFPVETLVYEADDRKVGYFKVRKPPARPGVSLSSGVAAATTALSLVLVGLAAAGACIGYQIWERRKRGRAGMEQELVPVPYKDLKSMDSSNNSFGA